MTDQLFYTEIDAARQLTAGSVYRLRKYLRETGILDAPIEINGRLMFSHEQIRTAKNRAERLAYAPTTDIKQVVLKPGERLA